MVEKAVIVCRVSSKEQEDNFSLEAQKERLLAYCQRLKLEVLKIYVIIESSTQGKRTEFHKALDFCKKQKETIALVFDAVDRAQRSFKETELLDSMVKKEQVELHFFREGVVIGKDAKTSDILIWDFSVLGAKSYILSMKENIARSINYKLQNGECISKVPLGYLNVRDKQGKASVIVDSVRAPMIKRIFELYSTGLYSTHEIALMTNKWGLLSKEGEKPLKKLAIHRILSNPFYYGELRSKKNLYQHQYVPLVSYTLFRKCEEILKGRNLKNQRAFRYSEKPFIFRGLIKCGQCGCTITSDLKVKKNTGKEYTYLFCSHYRGNCNNKPVNENVVLEQIENIIKNIHFPVELSYFFKTHLESILNAENDYHKKEVRSLNLQYEKNQERIKKFLLLFAEEKITQEEYNMATDSLKSKQREIEETISAHKVGDEKFIFSIKTVISMMKNALENFKSSKVEEKREIINLLLSNLSLNDGKLSYTTKKPFDKLSNSLNVSNGADRETRTPDPLITNQ